MKVKALASLVSIAVLLTACNQSGEGSKESENQAVSLDTQSQKLSYIFGHNIGSQFKAESMDIDLAIFKSGLEDALNGVEPKLKEEEIIATLQSYQEQKMTEQQQAYEGIASANKAEGETFLKEKAAEEGVVTLESGLQYKVITEGSGEKPTADSTVEVHYKGTLVDGTEFDSSYKRGVPATFGVTQVIPGWTEALMLMPEGSKWEIYLPPELAYGSGGAGGAIGPEQTLIFEVELLKANVASEDAEAEPKAEAELEEDTE